MWSNLNTEKMEYKQIRNLKLFNGDNMEYNEGADFILAGGYLAKHCPYWGYNKEFKR